LDIDPTPGVYFMANYDEQLKLKLVSQYRTGTIGFRALARKDGVSSSALRRWVSEAVNRKVASAIIEASGLRSWRCSRSELNRYMRTEDNAVKSCSMPVEFSFAWGIDVPPKTHRNMYDVMDARCHYTIRKRQNEYLHELYSVKTG
jgi:transposase-like protein